MSGDRSPETAGRYVVRLERHLPHPVERVWSALVKPEQLSQWYPLDVVDIDLQVGGRIVFDDGEGTIYRGEIQEMDHPRVFSFTEENDLLHIRLEPDGAGCLLIFTHSFDDASIAESVETGWNECLNELERMVSGG